MKPTVTLVVRKLSSGYRVCALAVDSLDHAWSIANVLVRAPEYSRCFVAATGWDGSDLWVVGMPAPSYAPAPARYAAPPQYSYAPALPQHPQYAEPLPRPPAFTGDIIDAEPEPDPFGPPPALPPRRW
jgi:hypothetical protein